MKNIFKKLKDKFDIFSLGVSASIYFLVIFFTVPFVYLLGIFPSPSTERMNFITTESIYLVLVGFLFLILGSYLGHILFKKIKVGALKKEWVKERVFSTFITIFLLGLFFKLVRILGGAYFHTGWNTNIIPDSFYSLVGLFTWFGVIALAIAFSWYYYLRKEGGSYKTWQYIAFGTLFIEMAYALPTCSKLTIVIPILITLIIRWYLWERSYKSIAIVGLVVFLIFPYARICQSPSSFSESSVLFDSNNKIEKVADYSVYSFTVRIDQLLVFSKIVESDLPKLHGRDYKNFFISLAVPRFLWENKPIIVPDGNAFGKSIGILNQDDRSTSIGPTVLGDFYINFGILGVIFGMLLLGLFFSFLYSVFIRGSNLALSGVMIYSITWIQFIKHMENWLMPVLAGYVKLLVIMLVIHWFLTRKK